MHLHWKISELLWCRQVSPQGSLEDPRVEVHREEASIISLEYQQVACLLESYSASRVIKSL